jgi:hypothetical protein
MAESDFQTELLRGFGLHRVHAVKIPDAPFGKGSTGSRFNLPRPYDMYAVADGKFHAIELKQKTGNSMAMSAVEEHQIRNLLGVVASGGSGWLSVNFKFRSTDTWQKSRIKRGLSAPLAVDIAYAAPIQKVEHARVVECYHGLSLEWWEQNGVKLPLREHDKKRYYDPGRLLYDGLSLEWWERYKTEDAGEHGKP